jgi:hypothetical protein
MDKRCSAFTLTTLLSLTAFTSVRAYHRYIQAAAAALTRLRADFTGLISARTLWCSPSTAADD